ncbi:GNAT family N-acetyltransferase [Limoniibacter endophyticus]|uniref:N-acetyltransferase n=1 Tax=Limoniibacter endophyticus TaxID=1565040 RepID=A0A8J3GFJ5_9HYPH|nr:GNAT family N-acetyltransferase [Limoniibacter endophyticus]GHC67324.1 N-acetyltransferase [Limoniibacter endophyticus]
MIAEFNIREAVASDRGAIKALVERAFGIAAEASLVEMLAAEGSIVLELVAEKQGKLLGHVAFSRLVVETGQAQAQAPAVALAPVSVEPDAQACGIGTALITRAHALLEERNETLSIVLGDPDYYGRFGYAHDRAAGFDSDYQCAQLQARVFSDSAPEVGRLVYPRAFDRL